MAPAFQGSGTGARGYSRSSFLLVALVCFCIRGSTALIQLIAVPGSPVLGGNVLLTFSLQKQMYMVNWYRAPGDQPLSDNVIITYSPESKTVTNGAKITGRERVLENGSLEITNLQTSDSGYYTVRITTPDRFYEQDTINLLISSAPVAAYPTPPPRPAYVTTTAAAAPPGAGAPVAAYPTPPPRPAYVTTTAAAAPPGADDYRGKTPPVGAIVGAIAAVASVVLLVAAAFLLYKRRQNRRRTNGEHSTDVAPEDLKIHSQKQRIDLDQSSDPMKNQISFPGYETVLPSSSQDMNLQKQEDDHIYMDLDYADRNVYNHLQK